MIARMTSRIPILEALDSGISKKKFGYLIPSSEREVVLVLLFF
jgi:hypothetical protein